MDGLGNQKCGGDALLEETVPQGKVRNKFEKYENVFKMFEIGFKCYN